MIQIKTQINELRNIQGDPIAKSDIYTRYRRAFDKLLTLEDMTMPYGPGDMFYLSDTDFEEDIGAVINDTDDSISVVVGYGGVGKSTSLRHIFKYRTLGATFHGENKKLLLFAAHYNGYVSSEEKDTGHVAVRDDLRQRIDSVSSFLEKHCKGLYERFISDKGQDEYYTYIEETNGHILENLSYKEKLNLSTKEQRLKKLERAFDRDEFTCAATKLKYYMGCKECPCEKIIIILDDIEPLPYKQQRELVMQYSKFISCMKNRLEKLSEKPYTVHLIISMRPYSYMELNRDEAFRVFFITRRIFKRNRIDFGKLLEKKINYYSTEIPHERRETWNDACNILKILTKKFNSQYSEMIKNLVLWDIRDSIGIFKDILMNRVWIQRNMEKISTFSINEDNFVFNNITVLRAISCGSSFIYKESLDNPVPNILQNDRGDEYWWFPILSILAHFKPKTRTKYTYGSEPEKAGDIYKMYETVFPNMNGLKAKIQYSLNFLFESRIIMRGIDDINANGGKQIYDDTLLHLSPRGYELTKMAGNDSVYLELCREAVYRDYSREGSIPQSSYELMRIGKQYMIFIDLLQFVLELLEEEKKYIKYSITHNTLPQYINAFGNEIINAMFLTGIENSIRYSGHDNDDRIMGVRNRVNEKITELRSLLIQ